ncbi:MAG: glutathione S-transferase family protein [Rhodanobacteraceae bacterium]
MKLLATPNSPYCRIARICALEVDVDLDVEFVGVRDRAKEILEFNPAGKVPTLIDDRGYVLSDTRMICEVLQTYSEVMFLAPLDHWEQRAWEGYSTGFLDGVAVWVREERRDPGDKSDVVTNLERARAERCLEYFDTNWALRAKSINYATATLFSALELMDTRVARDQIYRYPKLSRWYDATRDTASIEKTRPQSA